MFMHVVDVQILLHAYITSPQFLVLIHIVLRYLHPNTVLKECHAITPINKITRNMSAQYNEEVNITKFLLFLRRKITKFQ